jgi:PAS domain S-box-containing protein
MVHDAMKKLEHPILNKIAPFLTLAMMLAASVWVWRYSANYETAMAQDHFDEYCELITKDITERLNTYRLVLKGGVVVFLASEEVSREDWRAYCEYQKLHNQFPGIKGISFLKIIAPGELVHHVESIRAEGFPEYSVYPGGERTLYTPVVFFEPMDARNRQAIGYDSFSEPIRREAIERARDTATVAMSGVIRLVTETEEELQAGFLIVAPVYARDMPQSDVEERRAAIRGYVCAVLRVKDFKQPVIAMLPQGVSFASYDGATVSQEALVFSSCNSNEGPRNEIQARFSSHKSLELMGHTWYLVFRSTPKFEDEEASFLPWLVLVAGISVSILVFLLIRSQQNIVAKAWAIAARLTADLRQSEQRMIYLNTVSPAVIYTLNAADFSSTWVSPNVTAVTGYQQDEALQPGWWEGCLHPEDRERILAESADVFNTGRVVREYRFQRKDGEFVWILDEIRLLRDDSGQPKEIVGSQLVVTERRQAEDAVRQAKEDWEKTFDAVPDGIMILDLEYRIKQVNRTCALLLGLQKADCLGRTCHELLHGTVEPPSYCPHVLLLEDGLAHTTEIREEFLGKDLALGAFPLRNSTGCLVGSVHVICDITERKQMEKILSASENRYRGLVELSPDLIGIHCDGKWVFINKTGALLLGGMNPTEFIGKPILDIVHPDFLDTVKQRVHTITSKEEPTSMLEQKLIRVDGRVIDVEGAGVPIIYQGKPAAQIFIRDITERKQSELDKIARQSAEQANRAKSVFLANMSHEIRTPLNAVIGFAQILERDASLTPRQTEMLHTITRSGRHLLDLINDILDMSKIEAGRLELSPDDFCFYDLLDGLEIMFRSRAQAKELQFLIERDDNIPRYINADEGKLRQVMINLMGNAVKFTKTGGVAVRIRVETATVGCGDTKNVVRLMVEVEDSGPGISEDELGVIFEPFRQLAAGQKAGGTGLGLAVSRRLVELMGGNLTVKSQVGKGTCFRFDVLVTPAEGVAPEMEQTMRQVIGIEPGTGSFRILVADDQKDNRDLLTALLEPLGFEIMEAVNGQEALDIFEAWSPHAVLMDMRMPTLDGYEATRRIKATEKGRNTPVIAVTASAFDDAEREVMATGVDGYVRKPFRPEEIFVVLEKCLGLRYVYAEGSGQSPDKVDVQPLTREDLSALPVALRQAMRQTVDEGDMARLRELIIQVEEKEAATAHKLRNLANQYDYETLSLLLANLKAGELNE